MECSGSVNEIVAYCVLREPMDDLVMLLATQYVHNLAPHENLAAQPDSKRVHATGNTQNLCE
jgi:hypothetical protein